MSLLVAACSGESGKLRIQSTFQKKSALRPTQAAGSSLVISRARIGVSEIEIEGGADDEREASMGEAVIDAALDGNATTIAVDSVEAGTYHTLGLELQQGDFAGSPDASIVVEGTFNGNAFTYRSGIEPEVEFRLEPEINVPQNGSASVTLTFDVAGWFEDEQSNVLDPTAGNNQGAIDQGILRSMAVSGVIEDESNESD